MTVEAFDLPELRQLAHLPEITLDIYKALPEDISKQIEVVDGWIVRCESAEPTHQTIQRNFTNHLWTAVKAHDTRKRSCHRVLHDIDVLIADAPKLHFRRPDVVAYRCVDKDRGPWGRKPYASDCVIVLEIVSADSVATDLRDKRAEYAGAGIPHYWIVRLTDNDGPAISVERLLLTLDGNYVSEGVAVRGRDFHAVSTINPFALKLTWEQLDDGL
jgi:Uma2 family endonuclease